MLTIWKLCQSETASLILVEDILLHKILTMTYITTSLPSTQSASVLQWASLYSWSSGHLPWYCIGVIIILVMTKTLSFFCDKGEKWNFNKCLIIKIFLQRDLAWQHLLNSTRHTYFWCNNGIRWIPYARSIVKYVFYYLIINLYCCFNWQICQCSSI